MCFKEGHTHEGDKLKSKMHNLLLATSCLTLTASTCKAETFTSELYKDGYPDGMAIMDSRGAYRWEHGLESRAWDDWAPSKPLAKKVQIKGAIADVGRIYEIEIVHSSGDGQTDTDCLQAILGAATYKPYSGDSVQGGRLHSWDFDFSPNSRVGHRSTAIAEYLRLHPSPPAGSAVVVFSIPLDVLKRYPGQFEEGELLSPDNLFVIASAVREEGRPPDKCGALRPLPMYRIIDHYAKWQRFFAQNPNATRSDVVKFKETLRGV